MVIPTMLVTYKSSGQSVVINAVDFDESIYAVPDAGDQGSSEAHNLAKSGSSPGPATTPDVPDEEPEEVADAPKRKGRARKGR